MVTFRFYVVSTVAFFLALAVGVVVGSVLDGRIADSLQDRLERVETSLDETVASIDQKNDEIDRLEQYVAASAPFAVQGTLTGTSTVVVAEAGLPGAPVDDLVRRLREAGSRVDGIVWLEPKWSLGEPQDLATLTELVGAGGLSREALRTTVLERILDASRTTSDATTTTTTSVPEPDEGASGTTTTTETVVATTDPVVDPAPPLFELPLLVELASEGFVRLQTVDGGGEVAGGPPMLIAATGTASTLEEPGDGVVSLVGAASAAGVPSVLAEVQATSDETPDPDQRGRIVAAALDAGPVQFSTVDDLDLIAGRVASVLALSDLRLGVVGRFGYGPDVDGILPRWQGP